MLRKYNIIMCAITEELKRKVWSKALAADRYDAAHYRKDACGAWICFDKYGTGKVSSDGR